MQEIFYLNARSVRRFAHNVFTACGASVEEAGMIAEHLTQANLMGYDSHGIIRICQYVRDVERGRIVAGANVVLKNETETTTVVDCGWNFGQVGAYRALQCALDKAKNHHLGMVVTQRCNHVGRLGAYTQAAAEQGFIALGFCNSPPGDGHFVVPWGGQKGRLSTNPMSFAVPCIGAPPILGDFSTSQTPEGKLRLYLNQKKRLPNGWIIDAQGNPSNDPSDFYGPPKGAILPFGYDLGYRGFALSLLVETLAGLLSGTSSVEPLPGNGLCFIVVRVASFLAEAEFARLSTELRAYLKSCPPDASHQEITLPGELDFRMLHERTARGIPVDAQSWEQICAAAASVGVNWIDDLED